MSWNSSRVLTGIPILIVIIALLIITFPHSGPAVVVYSSVDAVYAEKVFQKFEKETGIHVLARLDSEITKTTGLLLRLRNLRDTPDGDVFWNSELSATLLLASEGIPAPYQSPSAEEIPDAFRPDNHLWTGFGGRARVVVYHADRVSPEEAPKTLFDLADPKWKNKAALAKPLFGTTRAHLVSVVLTLGKEKAFALFQQWKDNGIRIEAGNSTVCKRINEGICDVGLTDTDDVLAAQRLGQNLKMIPVETSPDHPGVHIIPNTVLLINKGPNTKHGKAFIDWLLKPETEKWLVEIGAIQITVRDVGSLPEQLSTFSALQPAPVNHKQLADKIDELSKEIDTLFR